MEHRKFRNVYSLCGIFLFGLMLVGSVGTQRQSAPVPLVPKFDFSPPSESVTEKKDLKLCLIKPRFNQEYLQHTQPTGLDKKFLENMRTDYEEMLIARGYAISNTHTSWDDLVYADKNDADLVLEVEVKWEIDGQQSAFHWEPYVNPQDNSRSVKYWYDGQVNYGGRMKITLSEPFTREKVMTKALPLPDSPIYLKTYNRYISRSLDFTYGYPMPVDQDVMLYNAIVPAMEKIYDESLALAWRHLEPVMLQTYKKQAADIKKNSSFSK